MQDEIDTEEIIRDIFLQGKACFIPRYQFQSSHMDMVRLASPEEISSLPKTSWNIHQPGEGDVREEALSTGLTNTMKNAVRERTTLLTLCVSGGGKEESLCTSCRSLRLTGFGCGRARVDWCESEGETVSWALKEAWDLHEQRPEVGHCGGWIPRQGGLDLIFVPGLGFDTHGNRLGRGKGYYDAYLKRCWQHQEVKPYTLALAFKEQICPQVPVDENDMKVDEVLYEDSSTC
ncbi:5-formyltetrahydrofolate cyclo-ligase isoform X3 [Lemur catta]|nr:5-formyltetrahydrofolate cyclo-ligase isoform X3 [Lemur catta]XP_045416555.1 5-formyltetrahydrofolate cyclo-ligase isoform X3 [Lemur catta]XP_045416557.1 5-formyltetrahydrofolate cyclo-ligase isoform X3 [Lemur catta]XP_045416558.1 5-formyltetrahydrofolate cyclo-ligase isoform X3 [Lemur catta]XP_045416559.1 5-formyltetrahydrofolate cyclo-ligase isoform X3 [Lemur catta]XP_045416560.1 5-formyltetrahydrofolate cyclo-ligase isoform X3 [Lemur catta]XP_045416561.1 5-formyltetrahydrofolate cyclo-l